MPATLPVVAEEFSARDIVTTLKDLMLRVTHDEATPATVQAACNCAKEISQLLRIHLEAKKLQMEDDKVQRAEKRLLGRS
jgi:hypothetical protein